jgi:hypothetical protein
MNQELFSSISAAIKAYRASVGSTSGAFRLPKQIVAVTKTNAISQYRSAEWLFSGMLLNSLFDSCTTARRLAN